MNNLRYILKDKPIAAWSMDSSNFPEITDESGNENHGIYSYNSLSPTTIFPLLGGSKEALAINQGNYVTLPWLPVADKWHSPDSFSIELWAYIDSNNSGTISLFSSNEALTINSHTLGITYKNNAIYFNIDDVEAVGVVENSNMTLHIVAVYTPQYISLYINGKRVAKTILNNFTFSLMSDENTKFIIGPTQSGDSFLIDDIFIFRYELSDSQILNHYNYQTSNIYSQISLEDEGKTFSGSENSIYKVISYSYPNNKKWTDFYSSDIAYNSLDNSITLADGVSVATLYDSIYLLKAIDIVSSKIEWDSANGISVYVSDTGEDGSYVLCSNGYAIPKWRLSSEGIPESYTVYLKIEISSVDSNLIKPKLKTLNLSFYSEKDFSSDNSGDYIAIENPVGSSDYTDLWDISGSSEYYQPSQRHHHSGYRPNGISGFSINHSDPINTVELIWKAGDDPSTNSIIFAESGTQFSWENYSVSKNNIMSVYLNGEDITNVTDLTNYIYKNGLYHIALVLDSPVNDKIYINSLILPNGDWSNGGAGNAYSNITIYSSQLSEAKCISHFDLYRQKAVGYTETVSLPMTELGVFAYDNDWRVIKSI